jgi:hypothetical protein
VTLIMPLPLLPPPPSQPTKTTTKGRGAAKPVPVKKSVVGVPDNNRGRRFCPLELKQPILDLLARHGMAHPLIPGYARPTPEAIRSWAVKRMYQFCVNNELPEVWAYLWENWYRAERWALWACAACPEIPILRTTMIVESQ